MNKILLFLVIILSICESNYGHLTTDEDNDEIESFGMAISNVKTVRNLFQVEKQIIYVLEITKLKQIGLFIYCMGLRLVGMQNLLIWQIVHLYHQSQQNVQQLYFNIGDYINGYTNPDIFTFQGFGYGYLFQKLNLIWEVGTVLFCIGAIGRFMLGPWFKNKAVEELEKRLEQKKSRKSIKIQILQQHNQTQGILMTNQIHKNYINHNGAYEFFNHQMKTSSKKHSQPFQKAQLDTLSRLKQTKESFVPRDSLIKSKMMGVSCLQTCDGSYIQTKLSNIKNTQSKLIDQIKQENLQQIGIKYVSQIKNSSNLKENNIIGNVQQIKPQSSSQNYDTRQDHVKQNQNSQNNQKMKDNFRYYKFIEKYSNILLKQIVFNILVNSLCISSYGAVRQIMYPSVQQQSNSFSYSGGFILITQILMLLVTLNMVLKRQIGNGQNRTKFKSMSNQNAIYWSVSILQRLIYGSVLASRWKYSIIIVASFKFIVLVLSKMVNIWRQSTHYYRYLSQNFIHFLIILILVLDQFYLRDHNKFDLSKVSIAWILLSLLILSFLVNFFFIVKESGIIRWLRNVSGFSSTKTLIEPKTTQNPNIFSNPQENLSQNQSQSTKRVKFNSHKQIIPVKLSKHTEQSIRTSTIQQQISQQKSPQNQRTSKNLTQKTFSAKSESMIRIKKSHLIESKPYKIYSKTSKNINTDITDAQRAQKTQQMVIQQTKQHQQDDQDQAQIVSIQLNNENQRNIYAKIQQII